VLGLVTPAFAMPASVERAWAATAPDAKRRPKLALIVSVDGLSWPRLSEYRPWFTAGLARLLAEGQVETACRYRHLNTETAPGHASLSTGAPPRVTGMVGNRWFERTADGSVRVVSSVDQPAPAGPPGEPPLPIIPGPGQLRVPTLGDRLVAVSPGSRVVSLSAKDRSACMLAGRDRRHAVYWYERASGRFVSSAAYDTHGVPGAAARAVVARFNREQAGPRLPARFGLAWSKLPHPKGAGGVPRVLPTPVPGPQLFNYQLALNGLGFDHPFTLSPAGYFDALYESPVVDELLADLALGFLGDEAFGLGRGAAPDLLALSFSAQDVVSHSYGNESEENLDVLRRLDVQLGRVLAALEGRFGREGVVLGFSADHGFAPIPEAYRLRDPSVPGGRLVSSERAYPHFGQRLGRRLAEELCLEPTSRLVLVTDTAWNLAYGPALPLSRVAGPCGAAGTPVTRDDLDRAAARLVLTEFKEEVAAVYSTAQRDTWPTDDPVLEMVRNSFYPERSGDLILIPRRHVLMHWDPGRGSGHGSLYDYDTHVPLVLWGGPFAAGVSERPSAPYDLAPTLAELLGVSMPDAVGRSLLRPPR
jgi:predicted AlkP superfamily pyrophosphatase or phosphodiesterase